MQHTQELRQSPGSCLMRCGKHNSVILSVVGIWAPSLPTQGLPHCVVWATQCQWHGLAREIEVQCMHQFFAFFLLISDQESH